MNQTIWAVQDFIADQIIRKNLMDNLGLSKRAITEIKATNRVGNAILQQFLGKIWAHRIETALEFRKLEEGGSEENLELLKATGWIWKRRLIRSLTWRTQRKAPETETMQEAGQGLNG